ncbi:hypothetical protein D1872_50870 [compost metagenome]
MSYTRDLSGREVGYLTVIERIPGKKKWLCRCKCGTLKEVSTQRLTGSAGRITKSCGCMSNDLRKETNKLNEFSPGRNIDGSYRTKPK